MGGEKVKHERVVGCMPFNERRASKPVTINSSSTGYQCPHVDHVPTRVLQHPSTSCIFEPELLFRNDF
jgi:hypothetical protein